MAKRRGKQVKVVWVQPHLEKHHKEYQEKKYRSSNRPLIRRMRERDTTDLF
jgi:hypothetical protein